MNTPALHCILLGYDRIYALDSLSGPVRDLPGKYNELKDHVKGYFTHDYDLITVESKTHACQSGCQQVLVSGRVKGVYELFAENRDLNRLSKDSVSQGFKEFDGTMVHITFKYNGSEMFHVPIITKISSLTVNQPGDEEKELEMLLLWRRERSPSPATRRQVSDLAHE